MDVVLPELSQPHRGAGRPVGSVRGARLVLGGDGGGRRLISARRVFGSVEVPADDPESVPDRGGLVSHAGVALVARPGKAAGHQEADRQLGGSSGFIGRWQALPDSGWSRALG